MKNNLPSTTGLKDVNSYDNVPQLMAVAQWLVTAGLVGSMTVAVIIAFIAITVVTTLVMKALMPKVDMSQLGGQLVNSRNANAPQQFVYGEIRKGGIVTFLETTDKGDKENAYLHQIVTLAGHRVEAIDAIYIDDRVVILDSNGFVTGEIDENGATVDSNWTGKVRIKVHDGSQTTADTDLVSETSVDSTFVGRGIAYLYIRMEYDRNVFANGVPLFTARIRGKKVYDPRTGLTAYSNNSALCLRDYLVSTEGLNDADVDDTYFSNAADDCDENVTLAGGGTEKRYTTNGIINADESYGSVLQKLTTACAGSLFWGTGKWRLVTGVYRSPVKNFTLDDFRSSIKVSPRNNLRDQFNIVRGQFVDASQRWIAADYPQVYGTAFIAEDGGEELPLDLELPFTTSASTAQRIAKIALYRSRKQITLEADFGLEALSVEVGDVIRITNPRYGWTNKEFEVLNWGLFSDSEAGDLRIKMTVNEVSSDVFNWSAEEQDILNNNTLLPTSGTGLTINNLNATAGGRTQGDGTFINSAILNWDDVANPFVDYYDVEWKATADSVWGSTTASTSDIEISPLVDGIQYMFRVRAVTTAGITGEWSTITFTGGGDTTAPALPTGITATGSFKYITVAWVNPADTDLNYIEVYENTTNTSSGATLVGISSGNNFVRANLGLDVTRWYFLKAVDYSGNKSAFTTGVSATTTYLDDPDFENGIYTLFKDQGLYAIRDVTSLPTSGDFVGEKVFNRADGKLYEWNGTAWVSISGVDNFADLEGLLQTNQIALDAITNDLIANNAVQSENIANLAITAEKVAASAITTAKIADGAIEAAKIADAAATEAKIATSAITTTKISDDAITTAKIAAGAITAGEIAAGAITAGAISANAVTAGTIAAGAVTAGTIAANAVTATEIEAGAITTAKIAAGAVTATEIAANAIISDKIAANAITTNKIAADAITSNKIAAGAVTATEIAAGTITGDRIVANTITGGLLATSGIITNSAQINNAVISEAKIQDLAVDTIKIANGAITSSSVVSPTTQLTSNWTTVATLVLPTDGGYPLLTMFSGSVYLGFIGDNSEVVQARLYINGVLVKYFGYVTDQISPNSSANIDTNFYNSNSSAGTTTIVLQLRGGSWGSSITSYPILYAQEIKR